MGSTIKNYNEIEISFFQFFFLVGMNPPKLVNVGGLVLTTPISKKYKTLKLLVLFWYCLPLESHVRLKRFKIQGDPLVTQLLTS